MDTAAILVLLILLVLGVLFASGAIHEPFDSRGAHTRFRHGPYGAKFPKFPKHPKHPKHPQHPQHPNNTPNPITWLPTGMPVTTMPVTSMPTTGSPTDDDGERGHGPPAWAMQRGNKFGLKRRLGITNMPIANPAAADDYFPGNGHGGRDFR